MTRDSTEATTRIRVLVGGQSRALAVASARSSSGIGQTSMPVLRFECSLTSAGATVRPDVDVPITVDVTPLPYVGWRELTLAGDGVAVRGSSVPAATVSARLTAYPAALVAHPPAARQTHALLAPGRPGPLSSVPGGAPGVAGAVPGATGVTGALTEFVQSHTTGGGAGGLLACGAAVLVGAAHAATPGHGKTVVAATVIAGGQAGRVRGRVREALALSASVTFAHTASVLVLGLVIAGMGRALPASLSAVLEMASGLLVVAVGVALLRSAVRRGADTPTGHGHGHGHEHGHEPVRARPRGGRALLLGLVGGMTPSPTALLILLAATAAGHTLIGVVAVVGFGAGMALALTTVGAVAAVGRQRLAHVQLPGRWAVLSAVTPWVATAGVLGVGCVLVARGPLGLTW